MAKLKYTSKKSPTQSLMAGARRIRAELLHRRTFPRRPIAPVPHKKDAERECTAEGAESRVDTAENKSHAPDRQRYVKHEHWETTLHCQYQITILWP